MNVQKIKWIAFCAIHLNILVLTLKLIDYARSTKPERKHEVQTYIFLAFPLTFTLTDLTLAFQTLLDLLWEWLTALPKWAAFSQIAHLAVVAPP